MKGKSIPKSKKSGTKTKAKNSLKSQKSGESLKKVSAEKTALLKELRKLISDIDESGLIFLIEQARVIQYNAQVETFNRELAKKRAESLPLSGEIPTAGSAALGEGAISIEEGTGKKHFIVNIHGSRKFFVIDELRQLVKICEGTEDQREGAQRLYRWFSRDRGDVLSDAGIGSAANPILQDLFRLLKNKYKSKA